MAGAAETLFSQDEIERGRRYHRPLYLALVLDTALALATTAVLAFTRLGDALYPARLSWWVAAPLYAAVVTAAVAIVRLPLAFWRGHLHEHRFGLSTQTRRGWAADRAKSLAVALVLNALVLGALVAIARGFPGAWPLVAAAAAGLFVLLLSFVAPVVLEPIFNRFRPLGDDRLAESLRALAESAGTPVRDVLVADASRRTRKSNAYVSGLGATRRVVLFDTLLRDAEQREIGFVVAHELAHRREHHVAKLTALGVAGAAAAVTSLWLVVGEDVADPRQIPLVLLVLALLELAALPFAAALSRRWERVADRVALELTRDPGALEAAFRRLAATNLADLDPPAPVYLLVHTHPTVPERIAAARAARTR